MIKEAVEDYKRHKQDVEVNNRAVQVLDAHTHKFVQRRWADLLVGNIIIVQKDEFFPADLLFLSGVHDGSSHTSAWLVLCAFACERCTQQMIGAC